MSVPDSFTYDHWRHGGWYVAEVRYPSGACGCVSRNYPDRKWRAVCADHLGAFRTRDDAARAEWAYAQSQWAVVRSALEVGQLADVSRDGDTLTIRYKHTAPATNVANRLDRMRR